MSKFSVVLMTAGVGAGLDAGGALVKVDGRECLLRSVELFLNRDNISQIQLAVLPAAMEEAKRKFGGHLGFSGVKLVSGGPGWLEQWAAAAEKVSAECSHVLIHDAARPAVAYSDIDALMNEAEKHSIVALGAVLRSTIAQVEESGRPISLNAPQRFMQVVTPWALTRGKFLELAQAKRGPEAGEIVLLRGSSLNIRVNGGSDAALAKVMIGMLPKPKIRAADNPFEEAQW
jgi:2-C-methyl-D-erythritol 4-phosphate cytidylyltransferase